MKYRKTINFISICIIWCMSVLLIYSSTSYLSDIFIMPVIYIMPFVSIIDLIRLYKMNKETELELRYPAFTMLSTLSIYALTEYFNDRGSFPALMLAPIVYIVFILMPYTALYVITYVVIWLRAIKRKKDWTSRNPYLFWKSKSFEWTWISSFFLFNIIMILYDTDPFVLPELFLELDKYGIIIGMTVFLMIYSIVGGILTILKYRKEQIEKIKLILPAICLVISFVLFYVLETQGYHEVDPIYPIASGDISKAVLYYVSAPFVGLLILLSIVIRKWYAKKTETSRS